MDLTATIQIYSLAATIQAASMTANILPGGMTASVSPASMTANINVYNITAQVTAGIPGEGGPPGPAAEEITAIAGESLSALRVVRGLNDTAVYADSSDIADLDTAMGITSEAADSGASVRIRSFGAMSDNSWNWDDAKPIFFTSTGALTQTPPSSGFVQQVAVPVTSTKIMISIKQSIQLV